MASTFELELATPERLLLREQVTEIQVPGKGGYLGVLPGHAPLLSELGSGVLTFSSDGRAERVAVSGGFVEVLPDRVRVLANRAERAAEIDIERAQRAQLRAMERLGTINPSLGIDMARAMDAANRAQARLEAAQQNRG